MKKLLLVSLILIIFAIYFITSPIYDFLAHNHSVPMLNSDYEVIPDKAPQNQILHQDLYLPITDEAITLIENHRKDINSPGISAAIAIEGKLVWAGTSGWSNLSAQKPLTTNSQFRIGSTSKALTSAVLARMVDSKLLTLDTPIASYNIRKQNPLWKDITPRHLASHSSGLPHYSQNNDWRGVYRSITLDKYYDDVIDSVELFDSSDLLSQPGEKFSYSSYGTVLLSAVIQEVSGNSYQNAIQELVFDVLNMTLTEPEPAIDKRDINVPELVTFYWHPEFGQPEVLPWREVDLSHRLAGGGFISTSSDLVKLGIGFNSTNFISEDTKQQFWQPQTLNNGEINEQNYAVGWRVSETDFGEEIGTVFQANHGGVSRGAQSWLMVIPEYNMSVAVNINSRTDEFWQFAKVSYDLVKLFLLHYQLEIKK